MCKPISFNSEQAAFSLPRFDGEKCNFFAVCAKACVVDAIKIDEENRKISSDATKCYSCGSCSEICPLCAIQMS